MLGAAPTTRPASAVDRERLAQVLTRAFHDDPLVCWVFDRQAQRERSLVRFFRWWVGRLIDQDVTWTTDDAAGAAVWALPGQWRSSPVQELRLAASVATGVRHPVSAIRGITRVENKHPKGPHMYLAMLGVDPSQQGRGLGSALITPGLEMCDEERWPAYLETAKERNVDFYGRLGFEVVDRFNLPRDGPPMWRMWREAR